MANLDQIMDYVADKRNAPFEYVRTVPYSTLSTGWPSTNNGFAVFTIEPSNTSNAYANIQDVTDDLSDVCKVASTGGIANSCTIPIIKGHTYKIRTSTSNIQADTRCYCRYYKIF